MVAEETPEVSGSDRPQGHNDVAVASGRHFGGLQECAEDTNNDQDSSNSLLFGNNEFQENAADYPEGGLQAWLVVVGSWCAITATFGVVNTAGAFQAWLQEHQLKQYTDSQIGWIFGVYLFLFFLGGVQVGPIFDTYGLAYVTIPGYIGTTLSVFFLSVSTKYYQIILGFAVLGGISGSMVFTPSIAAIGHWFLRRRGLATGLACTGGAFGGVIFPLAFNSMTKSVGFPWATRVIGFCVLGLCVGAFSLMRAKFPRDHLSNNTERESQDVALTDEAADDNGGKKKKGSTGGGAQIDLRAFKDINFTLTVIATYMIEWALFVPLTYITSYALSRNLSNSISYALLPILNAGSVVGRGLPGYISDKWGRFNVMIITTFLSGLSCLVLWLPAGSSSSTLIAYAFLFGVFSGTGISMTPVCVSQVCHTKDYGKRYGTCYSVVSFGSLTGIPIAGQLITAMDGRYLALIIWSSLVYMVGCIFFLSVRVRATGWKLTAKY